MEYPHVHTINTEDKFGIHGDISMKTTLPPESIDNMWVSAFVNEKDIIIKTTRKQRLEKMNIKVIHNNKLSTRFKPYLDEMLNKQDTYHKKRKKIIKLKPLTTITSPNLEAIYDIQQREETAVLLIQHFYAYLKLIRKLYYTCKAIRMIVRIQRVFRGYSCRCHLPELFIQQWDSVTIVQSVIRRYYSNKAYKLQLYNEQQAAIKIQCCIRQKIAYTLYKHIKLYNIITRIQALWRGMKSRHNSDQLYIIKYIIIIQKNIRKYLSSKHIKRLIVIYNNASLVIQFAFRTWCSITSLETRIIERELYYKEYTILYLMLEQNRIDEKLTKFTERFLKSKLREKLAEIKPKMTSDFLDIEVKEREYIEFKRQKDILTPIAIQQGWLQEVESNIDLTHKEICNMKREYMFGVYMEAAGIEEQVSAKTTKTTNYMICACKFYVFTYYILYVTLNVYNMYTPYAILHPYLRKI